MDIQDKKKNPKPSPAPIPTEFDTETVFRGINPNVDIETLRKIARELVGDIAKPIINQETERKGTEHMKKRDEKENSSK